MIPSVDALGDLLALHVDVLENRSGSESVALEHDLSRNRNAGADERHLDHLGVCEKSLDLGVGLDR